IKKQELLEKMNLLDAQTLQEFQFLQTYEKKFINYAQLKGLIEELSLGLTLADTSNILTQEVNKLFGHAEHTVILYLFHNTTGELGISSSQKSQIQINLKAKKGDVFDQWVVKNLQPLLSEETKNDFRFDLERIHSEDRRRIGSLISVPLLIGNKT